MMDFYVSSSDDCRLMYTEVYSNKQIIEMSDKFIAVRINAARYPKEVSNYNVKSYPTVIFFNSVGTEKTRIIGYKASGEFYDIMRNAAVE